MDEHSKTSYRQIFKATSLFGGVQAYNVLISLIRVKFVAVFLGPLGMGIMNLLSIPIAFIGQLSGLGLGSSAVRDISQANSTGDEEKINRTLSVFRKWIWVTGIAGSLITLVLARQLSYWTFGNGDYCYAFMALSVVLLLNSLSSGYSTALQGMRKLRQLAKATIIGSTIGLLVSIPLYYYFRIKGIVPTIIIAAFTSLLLNWFFGRKIQGKRITLSWKEIWHEGNGMVKLGILITLSSLISTLVSYLINIYVGHKGGIGQVGLYQAGFSITDKYVGLIFVAMATDYYPRLSGVIHDHSKMKETVNQQAEIAMLILGPILILLMTTLPLVVRLLYTSSFMPIIDFVPWIILGIPFKAASWAMGFIILAKGKNWLYFFTELAFSLILLIFSIIGYSKLGLNGLGISFCLMYILYFITMIFVCIHEFKFQYNKAFFKILISTLAFCLIFIIIGELIEFPKAYFPGSLLIILSLLFSIHELNKRVQLKSMLTHLKFKQSKK